MSEEKQGAFICPDCGGDHHVRILVFGVIIPEGKVVLYGYCSACGNPQQFALEDSVANLLEIHRPASPLCRITH